ncbi:MAG: hypothetical protein ACNA7V_08565 [Bacteroidales bacterium]
MRKEIKLLAVGIILMGMGVPQLNYAQSWGGYKKANGFWKNWSINANLGLTSFFGDLSIYDTDLISKFSKESGPAFGGILTKQINPKFGVSGQILFGNLKGANYSGMSFQSSFIEYNFQGRLDLLNILWPENLANVGIVAYGGIGQFLFSTTKKTIVEGVSETSVSNTGVPEFVYFFGTGLYYKINEKYRLTFDVALRQAQNDRLDNYVRNDNYDYYTHIAFGFTYHFETGKTKKHRVIRGGNTNGKFFRHLPMRRRR